MELSYDVAYENRQTQMDGGDAVPRMITVSNKLKASWNITKNWGVTMDGYHFYDNLNDDNKNFLMADAGMFLTIKHVRFTLNFNNILNKTTYSYSRITDLSTYRYTNNIRPRSIMLKIRFKIL
jgi:outer membrane receptor protein involved in Fe transport